MCRRAVILAVILLAGCQQSDVTHSTSNAQKSAENQSSFTSSNKFEVSGGGPTPPPIDIRTPLAESSKFLADSFNAGLDRSTTRITAAITDRSPTAEPVSLTPMTDELARIRDAIQNAGGGGSPPSQLPSDLITALKQNTAALDRLLAAKTSHGDPSQAIAAGAEVIAGALRSIQPSSGLPTNVLGPVADELKLIHEALLRIETAGKAGSPHRPLDEEITNAIKQLVAKIDSMNCSHSAGDTTSGRSCFCSGNTTTTGGPTTSGGPVTPPAPSSGYDFWRPLLIALALLASGGGLGGFVNFLLELLRARERPAPAPDNRPAKSGVFREMQQERVRSAFIRITIGIATACAGSFVAIGTLNMSATALQNGDADGLLRFLGFGVLCGFIGEPLLYTLSRGHLGNFTKETPKNP